MMNRLLRGFLAVWGGFFFRPGAAPFTAVQRYNDKAIQPNPNWNFVPESNGLTLDLK